MEEDQHFGGVTERRGGQDSEALGVLSRSFRLALARQKSSLRLMRTAILIALTPISDLRSVL